MGEAARPPERAVAYIDRTRELYAQQAPYRWVVNDRQADLPPWTPISKSLATLRIALIPARETHPIWTGTRARVMGSTGRRLRQPTF